jgi:hypothetical protein
MTYDSGSPFEEVLQFNTNPPSVVFHQRHYQQCLV